MFLVIDMRLEIEIARIAQRIKQRRGELGLSIREAAKLTGTSPSTIQKIEANEMVPSIAVLMKIAQGFKQNVAHFFEEKNEFKDVAMVRRSERTSINIPISKLIIEDLGSSIVDNKLDVTILSIDEGGESGSDPLIHEGEEIKYCMEGKIAYKVNGQEYLLEAGDCIHFKSGRPHFWKNLHRGTTVVFSVVYHSEVE
jgi:transcriptional regulator with XRE-family HTH domain